MIVIFTHYKHWEPIIHFISTNIKQEIIILTKFNKYFFDKADIIIPIRIGAQIELNEYSKYYQKFMRNPKKIYKILDDKINFYKFIQDKKILQNSSIKLINTYENYSGLDKKTKKGVFMLKHRRGAGSLSNKIVEAKLIDLQKKYNPNYQIQDVLSIDQIRGINCLAHKGNLISALNFITYGYIDPKFYTQDKERHLKPLEPKFRKVIQKIIQLINYSGFIEFEFIIDSTGQAWLMECNPRISGNAKCVMDNGTVPYITHLVNPYCQIIQGKELDISKLNITQHIPLTYKGSVQSISYSICTCGVMKFGDDKEMFHKKI